MKFIYDHLSASIISVVIFFLLVAIQTRGAETARDQTRYYSSKMHLLAVKEMIEHDFENVGAGVARHDPVFLEKTDSTFAFMAKVEATDEDPSKITYRRRPAGTREIDGEQVQLYQIERLVDDVLAGQGPPTMREFVVELRDGARQETAVFADVEAIYVRFVIAPPIGGEDELHEARYLHTFRPPNLTNF